MWRIENNQETRLGEKRRSEGGERIRLPVQIVNWPLKILAWNVKNVHGWVSWKGGWGERKRENDCYHHHLPTDWLSIPFHSFDGTCAVKWKLTRWEASRACKLHLGSQSFFNSSSRIHLKKEWCNDPTTSDPSQPHLACLVIVIVISQATEHCPQIAKEFSPQNIPAMGSAVTQISQNLSITSN